MTFPSAVPGSHTNPNYRADIDGLRAIAVLSVILFHINDTLLPGGFAGVDIFFVISGYLISRNILQELEQRTFSIVDFYRRRVKRIALPMLIVVGVTLFVAQALLIPEDAKKVAVSSLWSMLSLANVYFWLNQDTSYFAAASAQTPLLHLWSLGVEEQFYFIWPLLLIAIRRPLRSKWFFAATVLMAFASFAFGEQFFSHDPSFVYYMLPTRAGELLLGAVAALAALKGMKILSSMVMPTAIFGFLLVIGSLFLLSENQVFPGLLAIPPTLGAALLIFAGHSSANPISRLLALKPLVWIGLISYSSYLWHWPLLAFYRYGHQSVSAFAGTIIFTLTLLLAWMTYRFVEGPSRRSNVSARYIFLRQFLAPAGALALVALGAWKLDGFGLRWLSDDYKARLTTIRQETKPAYAYDYVCQRQQITQSDVEDQRCVLGQKTAGLPQAILWGDSNAAHYIGMLDAFASKVGFQFRNVEVGACPPLLVDPKDFVPAKRLTDCRASTSIIRQAVEPFSIVMISANWTAYQEHDDHFLDTFFDTARTMAHDGKLVILIGKAPIIPDYDRRCGEKALSYPRLTCQFPSVPLSDDVVRINARLKEFAESTANAKFFDVTPYLCAQGLCSAFDPQGRPRYFDPNHLSMAASLELGGEISQKIGVPEPFSLITHWSSTNKRLAKFPVSGNLSYESAQRLPSSVHSAGSHL